MSLQKTLRETIAPELNYLYTVPPFETPQGMDCGWFGREHALHAFFVARLLGATADLRSGDFAVISRELPPLTSLGAERDHAWSSINGIVPVDLGMHFGYFGRGPQLKTPIVGEGPNGDWHVRYSKDETLLDEKMQAGNEILFIEKKLHTDSEKALLDNPYLFLPSPLPGDATSWHAVFGPDIYAKISLHCFRCATDPSKSVRGRLVRPGAMVWIAQNYPAPEAQILKLLNP